MKILFIIFALAKTIGFANANVMSASQFIDKLKKHYKHTSNINAFTLTYNYLGRSDPYQSWDYKNPNRYRAFKTTDVDLVKNHYYQNVVHQFTGGLLFDEVHFQNSDESLRYERNGISLGKHATVQTMDSYERYKNLTMMNLDFFAIKPLLQEKDVDKNITIKLHSDSRKVSVIHEYSNEKFMKYVFNIKPLKLEQIDDSVRKRMYQYDDYQTNNGLNFAHSLIKYYDGSQKPSFIARIETFRVIDGINPEKLMLPCQYQRMPEANSSTLYTVPITKNTYLITSSSNKTNTLFKVNSKGVMVYGVPSNNALAAQSLKVIKAQFPNKPILGVYITHPFSDHIAGLLPYIEHGSIIYADDYSIEAIKAYPPFAKKLDDVLFKTIKHGQEIDGVYFYILENSRSKRQGFAYFKEQQLIYQGDFIELAKDNTVPNLIPSYSKQFINFIEQEKLKFIRIVGHHRNNNISRKVIEQLNHVNTL